MTTTAIIIVAIVVIAVAVVAVRARRRGAQASERMGLPPIGALSGDPVDGPTAPTTGGSDTATSDAAAPTRSDDAVGTAKPPTAR